MKANFALLSLFVIIGTGGTAYRSAFTYNLERGGAGEIKPEPWIWATDLSGNWFYRKNAVDAISKIGVVMLNVDLKGDGTIPEKQITNSEKQ